jgi:transcription elongation GreA/GreB family factor
MAVSTLKEGIKVTVLVIGSGTRMEKQLLDKQDIAVRSGKISVKNPAVYRVYNYFSFL